MRALWSMRRVTSRRARLSRIGDRILARALDLRHRGRPYAHLSPRAQAVHRAWLDTLMGSPRMDVADTVRARDGDPASTDDTARRDARGEEK